MNDNILRLPPISQCSVTTGFDIETQRHFILLCHMHGDEMIKLTDLIPAAYDKMGLSARKAEMKKLVRRMMIQLGKEIRTKEPCVPQLN